MRNRNLSKSLLINTLWSFIGRFGYITVGLISNIILVRLLSPKEFGQISIVMFFISIAGVLIESGLSGALVRKENTTETDYSTVFIFNLVISTILAVLLVMTSNNIASYYNDPELTNLLKLSSLVLIINALRITQAVKLIKALKFKVKSLYEVISILIGSLVGVYAAIQGAGAISLVLQQISTAFTLTLLFWYFGGSINKFSFSIDSFRQVYKFGVNTTASSVISRVFDNSYQLVLAKYFSISQSGYFYQAKKLQEVPVGVLQGSVLGVVYATLSRLQSDKASFNELYFIIVKSFTISIALVCMLIFYYADFIVEILYGKEWLISSQYLKILIVASFFYLQEILNRILFKIFDRTDIILKLEVIKKSILSVTIFYGVWTHSIHNLLYGFLIVSIISFIVNYSYARKVHPIPYWSELSIIIKIAIIAITVISFHIYVKNLYDIHDIYTLVFLPFILIINFILLNLFKVINFKEDYKKLKLLLIK